MVSFAFLVLLILFSTQPSAMADIEHTNGEKGAPPSQIENGAQNGDMANLSAKEAVQRSSPPTPEEEAAVIRKLDWRLIPLVFFLYMLSVLDRSNLGNAKLAGMEDDIDLSGFRYNWLGTIFYIAYILSQWLLMGWKQFPPHIWCASVVFLWGFIASVQAAVFNWGGLLACRFFLGVAEAAYGPGVPLYLTYFYPREKVGFRHGVFIAGAAMGLSSA